MLNPTRGQVVLAVDRYNDLVVKASKMYPKPVIHSTDDRRDYYSCPNCVDDEETLTGFPRHCPACGQYLDWTVLKK